MKIQRYKRKASTILDDKASVVILILANVVEKLYCDEMLCNTLGDEQLGMKLRGD